MLWNWSVSNNSCHKLFIDVLSVLYRSVSFSGPILYRISLGLHKMFYSIWRIPLFDFLLHLQTHWLFALTVKSWKPRYFRFTVVSFHFTLVSIRSEGMAVQLGSTFHMQVDADLVSLFSNFDVSFTRVDLSIKFRWTEAAP